MSEKNYLFKIWNVHRTKKVVVLCLETETNLYEQIILIGITFVICTVIK